MRGRGIGWRGAWSLALVGFVAAPAAAQRDTVVVRQVSNWQRDVDRLTSALLEQRRIEAEFLRLLSGIESRMRVRQVSDSLRSASQSQYQLVADRLRKVNVEQVRIRKDLESMCNSVREPEGWLGVNTTGFSVIDKQGDGLQVVRFIEPPVVESVDPGSPADRIGVRTGDVLIEIGGQTLLRQDVVFAELLRPGEQVTVKLRRGGEVIALKPIIQPVPTALRLMPCRVDAGTAYILTPPPGARSPDFEAIAGTDAPKGYAFSTGARQRSRGDTTSSGTGRPAAVGFVSPMARIYARVANPVAGLQMVAVNPDLARTLGVEHGLMVIEALQGTPGRESGLRGGDVIVAAEGQDVRSVKTLQDVINRLGDSGAVSLIIVRDRKREKITLRWKGGEE